MRAARRLFPAVWRQHKREVAPLCRLQRVWLANVGPAQGLPQGISVYLGLLRIHQHQSTSPSSSAAALPALSAARVV